MTRSVVLFGRGPSAGSIELPDCDIAAVSSGIFLAPRRVKHFITLDAPKYFTRIGVVGGWEDDTRCKWWDFLDSQTLRKHVSTVNHRKGYDKKAPPKGRVEIADVEDIAIVMGAAKSQPHLLGWQPGWMDFPRVTAHAWAIANDCNFGRSGVLGAGGEHCNKSILFAVQVVARLGYECVYFAGVDLLDEKLAIVSDVLREWEPKARASGIEWVNLSGRSRLAEWMDTPALCEAA